MTTEMAREFTLELSAVGRDTQVAAAGGASLCRRGGTRAASLHGQNARACAHSIALRTFLAPPVDNLADREARHGYRLP